MRIARYVSNVFVLALAVPAALVGMQLPALTQDYETGLVQSSREVRSVIDDHERIVRGQYHIDAVDDGGVTEALRRFEPAHSDALAGDVAHWRGLEAASQRIDAVGPVFQPFAALLDLADDPNDERRAVANRARQVHAAHHARRARARLRLRRPDARRAVRADHPGLPRVVPASPSPPGARVSRRGGARSALVASIASRHRRASFPI